MKAFTCLKSIIRLCLTGLRVETESGFINNILRARNFFNKVELENVINRFRHKSTVVTCRGILNFRERCGKMKKRDLVTLDDDIQDELRNV